MDKLPGWIDLPSGRVWLTIGTHDNGWQASYIGSSGYAERFYHVEGRTVDEVIDKLRGNIELAQVLNNVIQLGN